MFFGLFIVLAGCVSLLENFGIISNETEWGIPLATLCFGLHLIHQAIINKKEI